MIKGLLFDLNGTVIDILTDETDPAIYRATANFLSYYGVEISPDCLKEMYFELNKKQRKNSLEEFPEFDVEKIFSSIIESFAGNTESVFPGLAACAARVFRGASRHQLQPYCGVNDVLDQLKTKYRLAAVSDGQSLWAVPELESAGLSHYFSSVTVSGDLGFRKPDIRIFQEGLRKLGLESHEVIFVGNDMYRDVYGAALAGMKTVFFKSNQGDHSSHGREPDYIIYDFRELPRAVEFLENHS